MAVNLSPVGGVAAQFFDNDGNVLSGGKIYTYAAGTSTNASTYTTSAGIVAHSNPIILDSAGRVPTGEIWLTNGISYKFVVKNASETLIGTYDNIVGINSNFVNYTNSQEIQTATAGQTVFTLTTMEYQPGTGSLSVFVDGVNQYGPSASYAFTETSSTVVTFTSGLHVGASVKFTTSAINASSYGDASQIGFVGFKGQTGNVQDLAGDDGADWIGFTQSGTGAVAISAQDKMRQIASVVDFGAVGDGTTDDTAAIQAALDAAYQVFLPTGIFRITSTISISDDGSLIGEGFGSVILNDAVTRGVFTDGNNVTIASLRVIGDGSTAGHVDGRGAIHCENASNVIIDNVKVVDARSTGISIGSCTNVQISNFIVDNTLEHGVYLADSDRVNVTNGNIYNAGQLEPATVPQGTGFKIAACTDIAANNVQTYLSRAYGCIVEGYITKSAERINLNNVSAQGGASGYSGLRITNYVNGLNVLGGFYRGEYGITDYSSDGIGIPENIYLSNVRAQGGTSYGLRVYYGNNVNVFGGQYISGTSETIHIDSTAGIVNIFSNAVVTNGGTNTFGYSIDSTGDLIPIKSTQTIGDTTYPVASTISTKLLISDSITAPSTVTGYAQIYVDSADGDLKVKFGDGTVKTIVTD